MDRRRFLLTSLAGAFAAPVLSEAQQAGKIYRVGLLVVGAPLTPTDRAQSPLRNALKDLGWAEPQNVVFVERRSLIVEELNLLAADLAQVNVDVIFASGLAAVRASRRATKSIPIVMLIGPDPVLEGLVGSLQRPGANVTGVATLSTELIAKRLGLIKELIPHASRVAYMVNPTNVGNVGALAEITKIAPGLGLIVQPMPIRSAEEIDAAFTDIAKSRVNAMLVGLDEMLVANRARITDLAMRHRMPAMYSTRAYAEVGGLVVYSADYSIAFQRVAVFIDKILRGAKPATLPIEQPTKFELVINLRTAKALGLAIPRSLLLRADHVIE